MIGIYKITSPTNRIYIGQSTNIERRFKGYLKLQNCKPQKRLFASFLKYGVENHNFEIIVECDILELNKLERLYQDLFDATGKMGMNCVLSNYDNVAGKHSEETKLKITQSLIGRKHSDITIEKMRKSGLDRIGIKEHMNKIRKLRTNFSISDETRRKLSLAKKGLKQSDEHRNKITLSKIGKKKDPIKTEERAKKIRKPLINLNTGEEYTSVKDAAFKIGVKINTLYGAINAEKKGYYKNKFNIIYLQDARK